MFNSKMKSTSSEPSTGSTTIIGAGTTITGDIESTGDIRIDGTLLGNVIARAKVLIGPEGNVEGAIRGRNADVLGKVTGQMDIKEVLQLRGKCNVDGDIFAGKLEVEPSATFNGRCHMGANVVELNVELATAVNS
ncbi:MAG: polymer-forming cytoskeletal protein [Ferruginibacter sp.]|nr:polymer-forming cytoskeletal protein [Ferruginibacter sp.]